MVIVAFFGAFSTQMIVGHSDEFGGLTSTKAVDNYLQAIHKSIIRLLLFSLDTDFQVGESSPRMYVLYYYLLRRYTTSLLLNSLYML